MDFTPLDKSKPAVSIFRVAGFLWALMIIAIVLLTLAVIWFNAYHLPYVLEENPRLVATQYKISQNDLLQRMLYNAAMSSLHIAAVDIINIAEQLESNSPNFVVSQLGFANEFISSLFILDFKEEKHNLYYGEVNTSELATELDVNQRSKEKYRTANTLGWSNAVKLVELQEELFIVKYYKLEGSSRKADGMVGVKLNRGTYLSSISQNLDSLSVHNRAYWMLSPQRNLDIEPEEIIAGVTYGLDTLWWYDSKNMIIKDFASTKPNDISAGAVRNLGETSIKLITYLETPHLMGIAYELGRLSKRILWAIQLVALLVIASLTLMLWNSNRKLRKDEK